MTRLQTQLDAPVRLTAAIRTIAASCLLAGATMAQAATVTVHSVIDLTQWNLNSPFGVGALGTMPDSVSFQQGDTIVLDIDFLGNQTLKFASISRIGGAVRTNGLDCPHSTSSMSLHDFSGNGLGTISSGSYQGCGTELGATFFLDAPGLSAAEFSGVTFTFANVSLSDNNLRVASGGRLDLVGQQGSIGQLAAVAPVPEPSDWALVATGLGLLGVASKRRRRQ